MNLFCLLILLIAISSCFSQQQDAKVLHRKKRALSLILPAIGQLVGPLVLAQVKKRLQAARNERVVAIVNHTGGKLHAQCNSEDDQIGPHNLADQDGFGFKFRPHVLGRTHFSCHAWWDGMFVVWPAYNRGAPAQDNSFDVYGYGVFLRGERVKNWGQH